MAQAASDHLVSRPSGNRGVQGCPVYSVPSSGSARFTALAAAASQPAASCRSAPAWSSDRRTLHLRRGQRSGRATQRRW